MSDVNHMCTLATDLARWAGDEAVRLLEEDNGITAKGNGADVVTLVDLTCEREMIARIQQAYPDHAILGEESGFIGDPNAEFLWMLDPLDGTNNFVMGLPMYGVCVTICHRGRPVIAVNHESVRRRTTSAIRGEGARRGKARVTMAAPKDAARTTVSWTQGYPVAMDDPFRVAAIAGLESCYKRVIHSWSPSIDWALIAEGHIGAYVAWQNERWDLLGGVLIVEEAGGTSWTSADGRLVIAGHPDVVDEIRSILPPQP